MVMEGIYTGIPRKMHRPVADGIVSGLHKDMKPELKPEMTKCKPSATQFSIGVFGAGATPQGDGDGRSGGKMKLAHNSEGMSKKMKAKKLEEHIVMHNM
jgi:hypothetical protein